MKTKTSSPQLCTAAYRPLAARILYRLETPALHTFLPIPERKPLSTAKFTKKHTTHTVKTRSSHNKNTIKTHYSHNNFTRKSAITRAISKTYDFFYRKSLTKKSFLTQNPSIPAPNSEHTPVARRAIGARAALPAANNPSSPNFNCPHPTPVFHIRVHSCSFVVLPSAAGCVNFTPQKPHLLPSVPPSRPSPTPRGTAGFSLCTANRNFSFESTFAPLCRTYLSIPRS